MWKDWEKILTQNLYWISGIIEKDWGNKKNKNAPTRKIDEGVYWHILKEETLMKRNTWKRFNLNKEKRNAS